MAGSPSSSRSAASQATPLTPSSSRSVEHDHQALTSPNGKAVATPPSESSRHDAVESSAMANSGDSGDRVKGGIDGKAGKEDLKDNYA